MNTTELTEHQIYSTPYLRHRAEQVILESLAILKGQERVDFANDALFTLESHDVHDDVVDTCYLATLD